MAAQQPSAAPAVIDITPGAASEPYPAQVSVTVAPQPTPEPAPPTVREQRN